MILIVWQGRIDTTNGMAELWRRVYEERHRETLEEIVPDPNVLRASMAWASPLSGRVHFPLVAWSCSFAR